MYTHPDFTASIVAQRHSDLARSAANARRARAARASQVKRAHQPHTTATKQWGPLRTRIFALVAVRQPAI